MFVYGLVSCANNNKAGNQEQQDQVSPVEVYGTISAEQSFGEQGMVTGRMVTGRMVTGRIVTARSPRLGGKEERIRVSGARIMVEELGISVESDTEGNFSLPVRVTNNCPCRFTLSVGAVRKDGKSYKVRQSLEITPEDIRVRKKNIGDIAIYASGGVAGTAKLEGSRSSTGIYVYVPGTPIIGITDDDGKFVIGDIPAGTYKFIIEKIGYGSNTTDGVKVEAGKITYIGDFELQSQGGENFISGKVVDSHGNPVIGAFIISDTGRSAISDRYGNFQIMADAKKLTVGKEGYEFVSISVDSRELRVELKKTAGLRLGAIKGKIYNWMTTKPVGGVTVLALPLGSATTTDRDGSFVISDLHPGSYTLMFIRSDYEIGVEIVSVANGQVVDLGILGLLPECILVKFYQDSDGDGFGSANNYVEDCYAPFGYVGNSNDCNDSDIQVHPGAVELCNGIDENCDGQIDEGVKLVYYRDADGDGFGSPSSTTQACSKPTGYVENNLDCNDGNSGIKPTAVEVCDSIDQDCDGLANNGIVSYYFRDSDGDGQGWSNNSTLACSSGSILKDIYGNTINGYVSNSLDCNDSNPNIKFGINETVCDGIDENCNGIIDDGVLTTFYRDQDGDGYGDPNSTTQTCTQSSGYVSKNKDCDDSNPNFNPGITEIVDNQDENCDGQVDNLSFGVAIIDSMSPVHYVDLDIDNSGGLHLVFNYTAYGGPMWLRYLKKISGGGWTAAGSNYYLGSGDIYNCSIDVSPDGANPYFSFSTTNGGTCGDSGVCTATYYAGSWTASSVSTNGRYNSVAFVENDTSFGGRVTHIVYSTDVSIVHTYAVSSAPDFSLASVIASSVSMTDIDMVISPDGATLHIVFADLQGGIYYPYYTRNLTPHNFNSWLVPVAISTYTYNMLVLLCSPMEQHIFALREKIRQIFFMLEQATGEVLESRTLLIIPVQCPRVLFLLIAVEILT